MTIAELAASYAAATQKFLDAVENLTEADLDKHQPGEWSPRQVIHHLADSEAQSYARLRRLIAEPVGSIIQGYDEAAWAANEKLGYEELPIENSLAVFRAVRAASHVLLTRLEESDLERFGEHTEAGRYSVSDWAGTYTNHPVDHLNQVLSAIS